MGKRRWMERLTTAADMQDEPLPGIPLVEIAGEKRVLIENHNGVLQYEPSCIRIKVKFGEICVSGSSLNLARMMKGQLIINGNIDGIKLERGRK